MLFFSEALVLFFAAVLVLFFVEVLLAAAAFEEVDLLLGSAFFFAAAFGAAGNPTLSISMCVSS